MELPPLVYLFICDQLWLLLFLQPWPVQNADKKGLSTISEDVKNLAKKARENSLKPADYEVWPW